MVSYIFSFLLFYPVCFPIFSPEFPFTPYLPFLSFSSFTFLPFSLLLRISYTFFTWLCLKITGQILRTFLVILALFGNKRPWERERDRNAFVYAPGRPSRPRQRTTGHPIRRPNRPRSIILPTKRLGRVFSSSFSHPFLSLSLSCLEIGRWICLLDRDDRVERGRNETITPFTIRVCLLPAAYMTSDVKRTDERGREAFVFVSKGKNRWARVRRETREGVGTRY